MLSGHAHIIVLFVTQLSSAFTTMGKLELRRLIPGQSCSVFGIEQCLFT